MLTEHFVPSRLPDTADMKMNKTSPLSQCLEVQTKRRPTCAQTLTCGQVLYKCFQEAPRAQRRISLSAFGWESTGRRGCGQGKVEKEGGMNFGVTQGFQAAVTQPVGGCGICSASLLGCRKKKRWTVKLRRPCRLLIEFNLSEHLWKELKGRKGVTWFNLCFRRGTLEAPARAQPQAAAPGGLPFLCRFYNNLVLFPACLEHCQTPLHTKKHPQFKPFQQSLEIERQEKPLSRAWALDFGTSRSGSIISLRAHFRTSLAPLMTLAFFLRHYQPCFDLPVSWAVLLTLPFGGVAVAVPTDSLLLARLSGGCRCDWDFGSSIHIPFLRLQHVVQKYQFWMQTSLRRQRE